MRLRPARLRAVLAAGLFGVLALAGCAPTRLAVSPAYRPAPPPQPAPAPRTTLAGPGVSSLANLPGWAQEDHAAALAAIQAGCPAATNPDMRAFCRRARALGHVDDATARSFLEASLRPVILPGPGLLTAYYAPEYPARSTPDETFSAAVRPRPADIVSSQGVSDAAADGRPAVEQQGEDGQRWPYPDRAGIELTPATDALAWMRPEDLFFLQIQGSGALVFPDGRRMRASYAADNGRPFVAVAGRMVRAGLLEPGHASAGSIRDWLRTHAGSQAQSVMDEDPRYVFFSLSPDDGSEPAGAAGVPLTAGRAIAVDPAWHGYGEVFWIDATAPTLADAVQRYRKLVMALDTGSAIRGQVRADLYLGRGERAGLEAGRVRHTLLLIRLVPVSASTGPAGSSHEASAPDGRD